MAMVMVVRVMGLGAVTVKWSRPRRGPGGKPCIFPLPRANATTNDATLTCIARVRNHIGLTKTPRAIARAINRTLCGPLQTPCAPNAR
eukprot:4644865-Lingulodinium_polyedra.AAC.1